MVFSDKSALCGRRLSCGNGNLKKCLVAVSITGLAVCGYLFFMSLLQSREDNFKQTISVMKTRLQILEAQYSKQVLNSNQQSSERCDGNTVECRFAPAVHAFIKEINGSMTAEATKSTFSRISAFTIGLSEAVDPIFSRTKMTLAFELHGAKRRFVQTIIGIPSVIRKESYLENTITHLLAGLTKDERADTLIVVYLGETDMEFVIKTAYSIEKAFPEDLASGLIEVISPNKDFYPDFDTIPTSLGDSAKRTHWRTKQNLDAIFLMTYAQPRCVYYLMIEDDVIAKKGYMTEINTYTGAMNLERPNWFFIQFSTTGGIGKLFRAPDLLRFVIYLQLFYANMPIDWLLESYLYDLTCGISKNLKECGNAKGTVRPTYKSDLFQHVGRYSSLKGKIQKVKGAVGSEVAFVPHANPALSRINCTVPQEPQHTVQFAYEGSSFAWLHRAKINDVIEFWFEAPTTLHEYKIFTASASHMNDKLYDAVFEIMKDKSDVFLEIDKPDEFGMLENKVPEDIGPIVAARIRFLKPSKYWLLITEIEF